MNTAVKILGITVNSQARRRLLVAGIYAGYAVVVGAFWLAQAVAHGLIALALPGFLMLGICHWTVSQVVQAYSLSAQKSVPRPDERQVLVRDRAFVTSYQILSGLLCLGILYATIAGAHWWHPSTNEWKAGLFGSLLLSATLPSAVIAWGEPDEPAEVEEEVEEEDAQEKTV
jgi:hypothetical protein